MYKKYTYMCADCSQPYSDGGMVDEDFRDMIRNQWPESVEETDSEFMLYVEVPDCHVCAMMKRVRNLATLAAVTGKASIITAN
jgi:hypothetical protein